MGHLVKILFLLAGCALLGWALKSVDLAEVLSLLARLGWGYFFIFVIYGVVTWVDTLAWKYCFPPEKTRNFTLWQLWRIRQIGDAYNTITPLGTLGGEPIKAQLLKDGHGLTFKEGLASQVAAKTTFLIALILFCIPSMVLMYQMEGIPPEFQSVALVGMVGFSTAIFLFFLVQITGLLGIVTRKVARHTRERTVFGQLENLDAKMSGYYKDHPGRALASVAAAFTGWVIGLAELYLILYLLGYEASFAQLWLIEALAQLVRAGTFFIPLNIGTLEGGLILIFGALGYPAILGITVSFAGRIKQLTWVAAGLLLGWSLAFKPRTVQPDASEG